MREYETNEIRRWQIRYIDIPFHEGCLMRGRRPGIIVSNNANNKHSSTVEVVYLTTAQKNELPTHVKIRSTGRTSTAISEQISTVSIHRVGDICGVLSEYEQKSLEYAMLISLGIIIPPVN